MNHIGTGELLVVSAIIAVVVVRRLPRIIASIRSAADPIPKVLEARPLRPKREKPPRITYVELITEQRDRPMSKLWKKFIWSPAFWALFGIVGLTTGLYFQRVAENGSGLWCLGLVFLGAAYL